MIKFAIGKGKYYLVSFKRNRKVQGEFGIQDSHGGPRDASTKYGQEDQSRIRILLWMAIKDLDPLMHLQVSFLVGFSQDRS
jgi:hypothetical protein